MDASRSAQKIRLECVDGLLLGEQRLEALMGTQWVTHVDQEICVRDWRKEDLHTLHSCPRAACLCPKLMKHGAGHLCQAVQTDAIFAHLPAACTQARLAVRLPT